MCALRLCARESWADFGTDGITRAMAANELSSDSAIFKLTELVGQALAEVAKLGKPKAPLSEDTFDFNIDLPELKRLLPSSLIVTTMGTVHAVAATGAVRVARDTGDVRVRVNPKMRVDGKPVGDVLLTNLRTLVIGAAR